LTNEPPRRIKSHEPARPGRVRGKKPKIKRASRPQAFARPVTLRDRQWTPPSGFTPWFCQAIRRTWNIHPAMVSWRTGLSSYCIVQWEIGRWKPTDDGHFLRTLEAAVRTLVREKCVKYLAMLDREPGPGA
jgi:hypothetical protein